MFMWLHKKYNYENVWENGKHLLKRHREFFDRYEVS